MGEETLSFLEENMRYFDPNSVQDIVSFTQECLGCSTADPGEKGQAPRRNSLFSPRTPGPVSASTWSGLKSEYGKGLVRLSFLVSAVGFSFSIPASFSMEQRGQSDGPPNNLSGKQGPSERGWRHLAPLWEKSRPRMP